MPAISAPRRWQARFPAAPALLLAMALAACGGDSSLKIQVAGSPSSAPAAAPSSPKPSDPAAAPKPSPPASAAPIVSPKPAASPVSSSPAGVPVAPSGKALPATTRLIIPSIGVDAPMVTLGVDRNGQMQVPNNGTDVGWYDFSALPGTSGNAVLSGHLDTATSPTAVFSRLKELKPGDALSIVENGKKIDFDVFWTKSWPDATAPLALILGNAPSPTLTLITCSGTFDRASRNYSERLVVRAKLPGSV